MRDNQLFLSHSAQVVEIYCEQVNDLLADRKHWPQNGHKPRLTANCGYVVDTSKKPCKSSADIFAVWEIFALVCQAGRSPVERQQGRRRWAREVGLSIYWQCTKGMNAVGGMG